MNDALRQPREIIRVVETFDEARDLLGPLAHHDIGAICMKGVALGSPDTYWKRGSELRQFAYLATMTTQGMFTPNFELGSRRLPRSGPESGRKLTIFTNDIGLHIDGSFTDDIDEDGNVDLDIKFPLLNKDFYEGVSHHMTWQGSTTFVMNRLSKYAVSELMRNQPRTGLGLANTNKREYPMQGEAVELTEGDFMTLHTFGVYQRPVFVHGTTNSSPDRRSISIRPIPTEEWII